MHNNLCVMSIMQNVENVHDNNLNIDRNNNLGIYYVELKNDRVGFDWT